MLLAFPVLLLLLILGNSVQAHQPPADVISACRSDAERICAYYQLAAAALGNFHGIGSCFRKKRIQLSDGCRSTLERHGYK